MNPSISLLRSSNRPQNSEYSTSSTSPSPLARPVLSSSSITTHTSAPNMASTLLCPAAAPAAPAAPCRPSLTSRTNCARPSHRMQLSACCPPSGTVSGMLADGAE
ncbi:hypothetical protein ESCO_001461 [Escovopsis weberi]|uniref:Uncharacterized protein n=1 Tax=Escovopsis weberi TaxID=150374 RepID=A0A0N0RTZ3_ESCWE|nr:hypothetical protein ESCO_001461 [Escovopsis weberi]